ncbi:MAG TPA: hypothetical protein ACFYD4_05485 [Candidatus Wunengus sp. YC61]
MISMVKRFLDTLEMTVLLVFVQVLLIIHIHGNADEPINDFVD